MAFRSTKTFGHELGLSACFRQWRANSHCNLLHGYALSVSFEFEADELDYRNWVVDFGDFKDLKKILQDTFDHKLLVAQDDPEKDMLCSLAGLGLADVLVVKAVGCEAFARMAYKFAEAWLRDKGYASRCRVTKAEVREHGANSAIYSE